EVAGRERDMDDPARDLEIGLGQSVERIVRHAVAAHIFRLRVGAEADGARQHGGDDRGGNGPAKSHGDFHRNTPGIAPSRCLSESSAMNEATFSLRSSSMAASKTSPLAGVARVGSP